jgi:hypothetical protein
MASLPSLTRNANQSEYWVVHPLDDLPEKKRDVSALGPMPMTPSVRLSLLALRGYLLLMTGLVAYHFLGLAAALRHLSS